MLSEYYTQMENAAFTRMAQLEDLYGVKWKWEKSSPTGNFNAVEQQISTVQSWTSRKFDVVFICTGANFATMQGVYKKAMDSGTNIFQFNQPVELYPIDDINTVSEHRLRQPVAVRLRRRQVHRRHPQGHRARSSRSWDRPVPTGRRPD